MQLKESRTQLEEAFKQQESMVAAIKSDPNRSMDLKEGELDQIEQLQQEIVVLEAEKESEN